MSQQAEDIAAAADTAVVPEEPAAREPLRVLVAEDEALIRMDLVEMLREEGYDVVGEAGDGAQAIELARELKPGLVMMDIKMPGTDGLEAATTIAQERIAPVVMLTAFSQRDLVDSARDAGAMAYLVGPPRPVTRTPSSLTETGLVTLRHTAVWVPGLPSRPDQPRRPDPPTAVTRS